MRKLIVAGIGAALVVFSLVGFASASASAPHHPAPHSLRFVAKTTQFSQIDLPPTGFGQGDEIVFHDVLLAHGKVIGHDGGACQATSVTQGRAPEFQCLVTMTFRGAGQVTTQGLIRIGNPASFRGSFAINGGTGLFARARGEGFIHQTSETLATVTLSITH
jgi:hypothetical protein